ncbi:MAG: hypothetical protein HYU59_05850 [Magnetospirillum gryphiswaldense]|nr:hypothetical protein [Magnetospirillum gryphiswaldense]
MRVHVLQFIPEAKLSEYYTTGRLPAGSRVLRVIARNLTQAIRYAERGMFQPDKNLVPII